MRNHKLKVLSLALLLLGGCNNTGSSGNVGSTPSNDEAIALENPVRLDQLGVLPASDSSASSYLLQLTNYSKDKYTLDSVRVIDLDTGKDSKLVSVAPQACSIVSANGSCSIQLTPHTMQSADVKLEVKLRNKQGEIETLAQLIRISGELNSNNGGIVMLNDVDRIITEDGNYGLSIPVVLGDNYDDIKASNGSLVCNTAGYQKGSSCTYQVRGKVTGSNAVVSTRLEGTKAGQTVTVQEANTNVEVTKGAHLLLSHGIEINHPESSAEITVFNNGNSAASNVVASANSASGLEINKAVTNACGATLAANANCKVKVNVKSLTNGQAPVSLTYKDGEKVNTVLTNVRYKVANARAGVLLDTTTSNLTAIVRGKPREAVITVKNTGNRDLKNVQYYLAPATPIGMSMSADPFSSSSCEQLGELAAGESCNFNLVYTPQASQASKTINVVVNGRYTDENGQSHSLVSLQGITYSATEVSASNLSWTKSSGNDSLSISNNNQESSTAVWKLTNTLAADENLPASKVNVSLNPANIEALRIASLDAVKCGKDATIAGNSACEYKITYGPTLNTRASTQVNLIANYNLDSKALTSSARFNVTVSAAAKPKIGIKTTMSALQGTDISGDGTSQRPWNFTGYYGKGINLTYTFTNEGNLAADKFNVDSGNLPNGAVVISSTCPLGINTSTLASKGSCNVVVGIPDPKLFDAPNLANGTLNSANLKIDLPYTYNSYGNLYSGNSETKYISFNRLWANIVHNVLKTSNTDSTYEFEVSSAITSVSKNSTYPITVTPILKNPIQGVILKSCTINSATETSCINKISLPRNTFKASNTYFDNELLLTFKTTAGKNANDQDAIISEYLIGSTVRGISASFQLFREFKAGTEGKLFILEKDIEVDENWIPVPEIKNATFDGQGYKITRLKLENSGDLRSGMFQIIGSNTTIKNLNLEGSVSSTSDSYAVGLLAGVTRGTNIKIENSNFKAKVTGKKFVGGVIGSLDGATSIDSVTVISDVKGDNFTGGLAGIAEASSNWKNIRVMSDVSGENKLGGFIGSVETQDNTTSHIADRIVVNSNINSKGTQHVGGVFGLLASNISMSGIDVTVDIKTEKAGYLGGAFGYIYKENASKEIAINNLAVRGVIATGLNPNDNGNLTAGGAVIATPAAITSVYDSTIIKWNNTQIVSTFLPVTHNTQGRFNLANVGNTKGIFTVRNSVSKVPGTTNVTWSKFLLPFDSSQKVELIGSGFDFDKIWTIKEVNGASTFGIKEDSIPQFPKW